MSKRVKTGLLAWLVFPAAAIGRDHRPPGNNFSQPADTSHKDSYNGSHHKKKAAPIKVQYGVASFYSDKFEGRKTYTDEIFTQKKLTGASNTLPMHTWVRVTNLRNHKEVIVRINDKMHPRNKRLIDLSEAAAARLGYTSRGLTRVRIDVLGKKRPAEAEPEVVSNDKPTP
jgi:rare lipoprotein A